MNRVVVRHVEIAGLNSGEEREDGIGAQVELRTKIMPLEECPSEGGEGVAAAQPVDLIHVELPLEHVVLEHARQLALVRAEHETRDLARPLEQTLLQRRVLAGSRISVLHRVFERALICALHPLPEPEGLLRRRVLEQLVNDCVRPSPLGRRYAQQLDYIQHGLRLLHFPLILELRAHRPERINRALKRRVRLCRADGRCQPEAPTAEVVRDRTHLDSRAHHMPPTLRTHRAHRAPSPAQDEHGRRRGQRRHAEHERPRSPHAIQRPLHASSLCVAAAFGQRPAVTRALLVTADCV